MKTVLLNNGNKYPCFYIAQTIHLKESYYNFEQVQALTVEFLWGPQGHSTPYGCASRLHELPLLSLSLCQSGYKSKDWVSRITFVPGEKDVKENLVDLN